MNDVKSTANDSTPVPSLIVFGLDDSGKAHASWFGPADAELAMKAAGHMGMRVLQVTTDEHHAAALGLAQGRVFASGKAFTPFCKMAAYEALAAFEGSFAPPGPIAPQPAPMPEITGAPGQWVDIAVGALVLACEAPMAGWFESVVVEVKNDDLFVLSWRDWPDEPRFVRRGDDLGLLKPTQVAA